MNNEFINLVKTLDIKLTDDLIQKLDVYCEFLKEYNSHTNITAVKTDEDIYLKHFYDSLTIIKAVNLKKIESLLDIGSGAGFPGMILKIFYPHLNVTLLDSNNKKTTFLKELANKLNIEVEIINQRAEDYAINNQNKFDIVVSRAVAFMDIIILLSIPLVKKDGSIILMKGNLNNELYILNDHLNDFIENFKIVDVSYSDNERNLVILNKKTDKNKILTYNQILKINKKWQKYLSFREK